MPWHARVRKRLQIFFSRIIFPAGNFQDEFSSGFYQKLSKFFKKRAHISPHFSYFHNNFRKPNKF